MSKIIIPQGIDMQTIASDFSSKLNIGDLEVLVQELNAVITRKKSKTKKYRMAQLYQLISETVLDSDTRVIFNALNEKLLDGTMTEEENRVFLKIAEQEENIRNNRIRYMIELAQLKEISLAELMTEMGFKPLANV